MAGAEQTGVLRLERAASDRSTCRATGEPIAKGEWRVGIEVWIAGRMSWTWQKPLPFLRGCFIEYCLHKGNCGTCKCSGHSFKRGEPRFVCTAGPDKKLFLSLRSASEELAMVLRHVGARTFGPLQFKGVEELAEPDRQAFFEAFHVAKTQAARFNKAHPPPVPRSLDEEPATAGGRPAKKPRTSPAAAAAAAADAPAAESAAEGEGEEETEGEAEGEGLTEYERQRLETIRRNRERMQQLQLPQLAAELGAQAARPKAAAAAKPKGLSTRKARLSEVLPRRSSLRVQGKAPDGSQVHSERRGEIIVISGEAIRYNPALAEAQPAEPVERHPKGDLPFKSSNGSPANDAAFIELLTRAAAAPAGSGRGSSGRTGGKAGAAAAAKGRLGAGVLAGLKLADSDVAKVTKGGITHLAFHPAADPLLLACADKYGNLGLWQVDYTPPDAPAHSAQGPVAAAAAGGEDAAVGGGALALDAEGSEGEGGPGGAASGDFDGVLQFKFQNEYISGLRWADAGGGGGGATQLFTGSYDGSLRALDLGAGGVSRLAYGDEESEFSAMDVMADASCAVLGDNEGGAHVVDLRAGKLARPPLNLHNRKINTVHFEPGAEQVFVTASTDASIHMWDLRTLGPKARPLASAAHPQACQAAYFAPDGSRRVASTSFDDTVRVWDGGAGLAPLMRAKHDNQTGRWVHPFRAVWGPATDCLIVGNMKRYVDVLGAARGELVAQLSGEGMTAIAARNCCHPALPVIASATASGRAHIYR